MTTMTDRPDTLHGHPGDRVGDPMAMFADLALSTWLQHHVRGRGYQLLVEDGRAMLGEGKPGTGCHPVWRDYVMLTRHNYALCVAAAGTHRAWWSFASGQADVPPSIADVPVSPTDSDAFACATCGSPAFGIDDRAIAWCPEHVL